jgi:O-antigen ligase
MNASRLGLRRHGPLVLLAVLLLAPSLAVPNTWELRGLKPFLVQTAAFGLLGLLLARVRWSLEGTKRFALSGPNLAVVGLVIWAAMSFLLNAPAAGRGREIALMDLLRMASGAVVLFAVTYRCSSRDRTGLLTNLVLAGGAVAAVASIWSYVDGGSVEAVASFGNKQLLGAFLVPLLPFCAILATRGPMEGRRVAATAVTAGLAGALLLTMNRSSWIGVLAGVVIVGLLALAGAKLAGRLRPSYAVFAILVIIATNAFLTTTDLGSSVVGRAATAASDGDLQWRQRVGAAAVKMIAERPIFGWGGAGFALNGSRYTELVPSGASVEAEGMSLQSTIHNEYLQIGVDLGLVGLALYLLALGGFFARGVKALLRDPSDRRRELLLGTMGAVAAQMVDALANPAWQFTEVSLLLWVMLGLGMAAARTHRERAESHEPSTEGSSRLSLGRLGWQATAAVVVGVLSVASFAAGVGDEGAAVRACYRDGLQPRIEIRPRQFARLITLRSRLVKGRDSATDRFTVGKAGFLVCNTSRRESPPDECLILDAEVLLTDVRGPGPVPFRVDVKKLIPVIPGKCSQLVPIRFAPHRAGRWTATLRVFNRGRLRATIRLVGIATR